MFGVFVSIEVKPEFLAQFIEKMKQQAKNSLDKEPNCGIFEVWTSAETPQCGSALRGVHRCSGI